METQHETLDAPNVKRSFPPFLMILLILTSINVLYQLYDGFKSINAERTIQEIQQELYQSLEDNGTEIDKLPIQIQSAFEDFFPRFANNFGSYVWFEIGLYLLMIIPVVLMFKRKRSGLWIYALLQVVLAIGFVLFFGANWVSISVTIFFCLFNGLWILLYSLNRKHLD